MKTNEYLYGENVEVPEIPAHIKMRRIELLNEMLDELLEVHYSQRDKSRANACLKARDFWEHIDDDKEIK